MNLTRILIVVNLVLLLLIAFLSGRVVQQVLAEDPKEVKPYSFAELPNGTYVYKMVHEGCEIFVAQNYVGQMNHADSATVAITTGRGCGK